MSQCTSNSQQQRHCIYLHIEQISPSKGNYSAQSKNKSEKKKQKVFTVLQLSLSFLFRTFVTLSLSQHSSHVFAYPFMCGCISAKSPIWLLTYSVLLLLKPGNCTLNDLTYIVYIGIWIYTYKYMNIVYFPILGARVALPMSLKVRLNIRLTYA